MVYMVSRVWRTWCSGVRETRINHHGFVPCGVLVQFNSSSCIKPHLLPPPLLLLLILGLFSPSLVLFQVGSMAFLLTADRSDR